MSETIKKRAVIVGGGLAGMACAVALAERGGGGVTLLEARGSLGGRAGSFEDHERPGEWLDNCQHVLLGCCTNLLDFYRRLGVREKIAFQKRVHFLDGRGRRHDLWAVPGLPAPLHLGPALALFSALTVRERVAVVRAMRAMLRLGRVGKEMLEGTAFGAWLDEHGQPESLVRKFYDPILVSALNEETRKVSAKYALEVCQEAMLAHRHAYMSGLPTCPLGELYAKMPAGIEVRLNTRVEEVLFEKHDEMRAVGVRLRGAGASEELRGDVVVLATNHHAVQRWVAPLPEEVRARDGRFGGLEKLESVPILGAHLWFDRPVMPGMTSAALIEGPLHWLFRKDAEGRVLHGVISAARAWVNVPQEEALRQFEAQVRGLFPVAREAKLVRGVVLVEKRATFSPLPGTDALRPAQGPGEGGIAGLYLAGDYTRTDWPATMEGAVRGGYMAASAITGKQCLVADLPTEWPARWMGL
jgi:squalene-associated FAD-dependent desaturase